MIDEAGCSNRYATRSRPFDRPKRGKAATNVINHCGDEVLTVFELSGAPPPPSAVCNVWIAAVYGIRCFIRRRPARLSRSLPDRASRLTRAPNRLH